MKRILISLVSDQTVPNILAIHHFCPDTLLFVSTKEMERKGKTTAILATLSALGLDYREKMDVCEVVEDSLLDCQRKLDDWVHGKEEGEFVVNLTCGTKMMSIAAYEFFKDYGARMVYIPIPKNQYIVPFPKRANPEANPLDLRLTVSQYLTACGLNIRNANSVRTGHREAESRSELSRWMVSNYNSVTDLLNWFSSKEKGNLRAYRDDKSFQVTGVFENASSAEIYLLDRLGFSYDSSNLSKLLYKSEIRYLTGGWLEEYCFDEALRYLGKGIDDVILGPDVANSRGRNNEFDVMFTKDNALYTIECKSLGQQENRETDALYKIGALQKDFGLRAESFLVSTSDRIMVADRIRPSLQARADQFKTTIIPPLEVPNFGKILAQTLHLTEEEYTNGKK